MFDKLFGIGAKSGTQLGDITNAASTTEVKNEIILGALRNILLICEICKTKRTQMNPTVSTTINTSTTTTTTTVSTTKRARDLPDVTTLPPPGKYY